MFKESAAAASHFFDFVAAKLGDAFVSSATNMILETVMCVGWKTFATHCEFGDFYHG